MQKKISIICPIYQENNYIETCINSILKQDIEKERIEVLFIDGMSTDGTRDKVLEYSSKYSFIHLLDNPKRVVPYALNIGIKKAVGDIIIRIDGHCEYPKNYISVLSDKLFSLNADNVGALWNTQPAKDTALCWAIAIGSSHKFGVGSSLHKVGTNSIVEADTVPFGCYKKEVFSKIGYFDEELIRNQDDEFNGRLINSGGKIYLIPELVINYKARNTFSKMIKMYYQYGLFKPLVNKKLGKPATLRQFFPLFFLIGIVFGAFFSLYSSIITMIYLLVLFVYFAVGTSIGLVKSKQKRLLSLIVLMPITFLMIHLSYGFGYLKGIIKIILNIKFNIDTNR